MVPYQSTSDLRNSSPNLLRLYLFEPRLVRCWRICTLSLRVLPSCELETHLWWPLRYKRSFVLRRVSYLLPPLPPSTLFGPGPSILSPFADYWRSD